MSGWEQTPFRFSDGLHEYVCCIVYPVKTAALCRGLVRNSHLLAHD
jgi:hypothetical protein